MIKKIFLLALVVFILINTSVFAIDTYCGYKIPIDIDINGGFIKCAEKPIMINNITYIPLRAFSDAIGAQISWNADENAATMIKDGQVFVFSPGRYCYINGIWQEYLSINYNNLIFIPLRVVSEALNYSVEWDDFNLTVKITAPGVVIPEYSKDCIYSYEDILYLSKIIQIESGSQPFETKLGVANTIINRVKSTQFPNSIKDVIFDTKYGVQFPPVHTDKINIVPVKDSVITAKCALNGINNVRNSIYFASVKSASSSWVHRNRPFYSTIGGISFYE